MADKFIKCEDALNELLQYADQVDCTNTLGAMISVILRDIPAADVRPVVTCEECVWHVDDGTHYCNKWCEPCPDNAEFFCAYGERDNCCADMLEVDDG